MFVHIVNPSLNDKVNDEKSEYLMKANNNNSIYSNYEIRNNPLIVTVFPNNKSKYVIIDEKKVKHFMRLNVSLKSILINLYVHVLYFKDISTAITSTVSTTAIAIVAEITISTHATAITTTNNNKIYFIKLLKLIRSYTADIELQISNYTHNYTAMTVTMYYCYINNCYNSI